MQFDARAAKLLPAGEHITFDDYPGLRLKSSSSGRSWIYRYKSPIDSRMRQTKLGTWPAMSFPSAIVQWEQLRTIRDAGRDPAAEKRSDRNDAKEAVDHKRNAKKADEFTVRQLYEGYLTGHVERNRKAKGATEIRRLFEKMLGAFADRPAATVTRAQAFDLLESHIATPVLAANLRSELGAAWDYALDAGRLPDTAPNWWRQIMRGRLKSKGKKIQGKHVGTSKRVLSDAELRLLLPWLPNFTPVIRDALTMYLWTGTRGAEILAMEVGEITEEADGLWWTVPKAKTKNARHENATDHRVPLIGRAKEIVQKRIPGARDGFMFPSPVYHVPHVEQKAVQVKVHFHQPYSDTRPEKDRPRLPVTNWSPHDLRRTARTFLAALGCPDSAAEAIIGHMQPGVKGIYNLHTYDKERREWLTRLDQHLESLAR